ncbi:MAG: type III-B CRISPR module-associated Cmr3 family protein [Anaerolineae bacterium]
MIALTFNLKLSEPVLAASLEGDPNSGTSYPFIPGSLIRGAVIDRYLTRNPALNPQTLAREPATRRLFFDGQTRYLNALLLDRRNKRTLPIPLSWYREKGYDKNFTVYDAAHPEFADGGGFEEVNRPQPVRPAFCHFDGVQAKLYRPEILINVHNRRERRAGRATEAEGDIFRLEALAPGQAFGGVILLNHPADAARLKPLLAGELLLGGSRRAGYGRVAVEEIKEGPEWRETEVGRAEIKTGTPFTLTFLSEGIIRDDHGQYNDDLPATVLARALGIDPDRLKQTAVFKRPALVGGFNRKWGLPLPQTLSIQAGSVFTFAVTATVSSRATAKLLANGLGERRVDGFGRVALNWLGDDFTCQAETLDVHRLLPEPLPLSRTSRKLAQDMLRRLARRDADRRLGRAINEFEIAHPPKKSQLGGLRVVIRSALDKPNTGPVAAYLAKMKATGKAQFEKGRVKRAGHTEELLAWLNHCLAQPEEVWDIISFNPAQSGITLGPLSAVADKELAREYTLRLIDGVLAKTSKAAGGNQ